MRREVVLAAGIAVLLLASAITAVVVPGVVAERDTEDLRPGRVDIHEVTIAADGASGGAVTLSVTTYLEHRGGDSENVSLRVRAVDLDSGMVATTREVAVDPISGDREVSVPVDVSVARDGGYRIETVLYAEDRRVGAVAKAVRGVGTVQTGGRIGFHRFDAGLPSVQYSVADAAGNRTALEVSTYLTNRGIEQSGPATVELIVRQSDSNIVASRTTVPVGGISPGETVTPGATVTVPGGYNYYLDAVLRKQGVIVDTARSVANLDPRERIEANTTVRTVGLQVEDFEQRGGPEPPARTETAESEAAGVPGFGPAIAAVAVLAAAVLAGRRQS